MGATTGNLELDDDPAESIANRVIPVFPTIVATFQWFVEDKPPVSPRAELGHAANYLYMLTGEDPSAAETRGLETYLNTVIDHGLNASTFAARVVVSTESDLVSAATAAVGTPHVCSGTRRRLDGTLSPTTSRYPTDSPTWRVRWRH